MAYARALFILQFHLLRHSLTQGKLVAYFIAGFVITGAIALAAALAWGCYLLGGQWLPGQPRPMFLLIFNALLLLYAVGWFWGLVMEVQRSDLIDIRKMLHFPVPLGTVNAINFAVSTVGFTSLFYIGGAAGLLLGLSGATGRGLLAGGLAAGIFFFVSSAWAYYLRGLLAFWMEDKRRRRFLLTVLPFVFMAIGFAPMMLGNLFAGRGDHGAVAEWLSAPEQLVWIEWSSFAHPGGQLSLALSAAVTGEGHFWIPTALLLALGLWGYRLGYRTTLRYGYGSQVAKSSPSARYGPYQIPWTARRLPLLQEETAALAQALFLNFARHPQVRTMLLAPIGLIILLAVADGRSMAFGQELGLPIVAILWPFFMFSGLFFNLFGMDQRGFRTILLLPTPRGRIILAHHLALFPLAGGMGLAFALFGSWYFGLGPQTTLVSLLQVLQLFLNFCLAGTFVSIYAPMTIGRNMMRKQQSRVLLVGLLMPAVVALLVLPTALCLFIGGFASRWDFVPFPVAPVLSVFFLALTLAIYPLAIRRAGDLLMAREQRILATLQKTAG